jgi:AcrR family transcriptional regulator
LYGFSRIVEIVSGTMPGKTVKRDSIIIAASGVFRKYGYRKTTMDDIAMAMGKGKSSIYYYFRNKDEIFIGVLEMEVNLLKKQLKEAVKQKKGYRDKLRAYIITRMVGFEGMINFYNAVKNEYLSQFEFMEQIRSKYDQEEIAIVKGILDGGVEKGDFLIDDTDLASVALVTSMKGFEIPLFITGQKGKDIEQRIDKLLKMLYHGILKK